MRDVCYWSKQYIIRKVRAIEYLGGKCKVCGYNKYYGALEFHHRDPETKDVSWTKLRKRSWKRIVDELNKCDLLCAICHREHHQDESLIAAVLEWRAKIDVKKVMPQVCKICDKTFHPRYNGAKFCSLSCASTNRAKVNWPANLVELVKASSIALVAKQFNVCSASVAKRLKKLKS